MTISYWASSSQQSTVAEPSLETVQRVQWIIISKMGLFIMVDNSFVYFSLGCELARARL